MTSVITLLSFRQYNGRWWGTGYVYVINLGISTFNSWWCQEQVNNNFCHNISINNKGTLLLCNDMSLDACFGLYKGPYVHCLGCFGSSKERFLFMRELLLLLPHPTLLHAVCKDGWQSSLSAMELRSIYYLMSSSACGQEYHRCHGQSLCTANTPHSSHLLTPDHACKSAQHTLPPSLDGIPKHPWSSWVSWWLVHNFRIDIQRHYHRPFDRQSLSNFNTALYERKVTWDYHRRWYSNRRNQYAVLWQLR